MFISVLICSRDRAEGLRRTLDALLCRENLQIKDWDIVVVDNDSQDHTSRVCEDFKARFPEHFKFCFEKRHGKSNALNAGIAIARGDVIAFTDDDVTCAPDYLESIRTVFSQYPVDAVQGRNLLECEGGHPVWLDRYLGLTIGWRDDADELSDLQGTLCGSNMVLKAEVLKKVGGFLPDLGPGAIGLGEETELSLRIRAAGYRLAFAPQILTQHHLPKKRLTKEFIRRRFYQQGRAGAYFEALPVPLYRFGFYVVKETIVQEVAALRHSLAGRHAQALRCQCEARSHAGFFRQHYLLKKRGDHGSSAKTAGRPTEPSGVAPASAEAPVEKERILSCK